MSETTITSCAECGADIQHVPGKVAPTYCGPACKQKAYRKREATRNAQPQQSADLVVDSDEPSDDTSEVPSTPPAQDAGAIQREFQARLGPPTLSSTRCHACGRHFGGTSGFDDHRVGKFVDQHPDYGRRCLSDSEMEAKGLTLVDGVWRRLLSEKQAAGFKR